MGRVTEEVRALLQERQDRRKAELDAHRRDVRFAVGDEVLLDTEHAPLPSRSLLSPRWMGPFKVLACAAPNTYRLDVPATWRVFPEFNVQRLRPYRRALPDAAAEGPAVPAVQDLLKFRLRYVGRPRAATRPATRGSRWSG